MRPLRGRWWRWAPPLIWMAAIFAVSGLQSPPPLPGGLPFSAGHFGAYALLAVLLVHAVSGGSRAGLVASAYGWAWVISVTYGVSDEWHQSFVAGRMATVSDVLADASGAAAGLFAVWLVVRWVERRAQPHGGREV